MESLHALLVYLRVRSFSRSFIRHRRRTADAAPARSIRCRRVRARRCPVGRRPLARRHARIIERHRPHRVVKDPADGHRRHDALRDQPRRLSLRPNHHRHRSLEVRPDGNPRSRTEACVRDRGVRSRRCREPSSSCSRSKDTAPATTSKPWRRSMRSTRSATSSTPSRAALRLRSGQALEAEPVVKFDH